MEELLAAALARAAWLLAGALMVRLIRAFLALPGPRPATGPAQHPAGLAQGTRAAAVRRAGRQCRGRSIRR